MRPHQTLAECYWANVCQKQHCKVGGQNVEDFKNHASVPRLLVGIVAQLADFSVLQPVIM